MQLQLYIMAVLECQEKIPGTGEGVFMVLECLCVLAGAFFCILSGGGLLLSLAVPSPGGVLGLIFRWTLWLASGCFAATVAELAGRKIIVHALLGLAVPYLYPAWLIWSIRHGDAKSKARAEKEAARAQEERKNALADHLKSIQGERDRRRRARMARSQGVSEEEIAAREAAEAAQAEAEAAGLRAAGEEAARVQAERDAAGSEVYKVLYAQPADASGSRPGPFAFTLTDGRELEVQSIRNMEQNFMVCIVGGKSLRVQYAQVAGMARYETGSENNAPQKESPAPEK